MGTPDCSALLLPRLFELGSTLETLSQMTRNERYLPRTLPPLQLVPLLGTLANRCSAHVFERYPRRTPAKSTDIAFRGSSALTSDVRNLFKQELAILR
ncbi:hypothetical protein PIB30_098159 [Stylosanthes scabra]|uniref:Uncharacterized protein n=1 Tax=Stylosanthes scabra TaxID=79078 RepID=A0ABU6TYJ7_9FABA|nr:hypothetical protein [Stylosanthes scabra]